MLISNPSFKRDALKRAPYLNVRRRSNNIMVSLVDKTKWATLVGRLFLSFGTIESATHDCIRNWAGEVVYKHVKKMPLTRRIELAIDLLANQEFSEANKALFLGLLKNAKTLVEQRNIIAHSPLALVLFQEEPETPFREAIASNTDENKLIEFAELQEAVKQAEAISENIHGALAMFRFESLNLEFLQQAGGLPKSSA